MEKETLYRQLISNSLKLQQHMQLLTTQQVLLQLVTTLISQRYITLQTGQVITDKFILTT